MADNLTKRKGYWHFQRRVPEDFSHLDKRGIVRHSTKVAVATDKRGNRAAKIAEIYNRDLEAYWRGLYEGKAQEAAKRYADARRRARIFGFAYIETEDDLSRPSVKPSEVFSKDMSPKRWKNMSPKRRKKNNKQPANKQIAVPPIEPILVNNLVGLAEAFVDATGVKITTVGANSTKTASFYTDLKSGKTSCTLRKYDLLTKRFAENSPEDHTMPTLKDPQHYPNPKGK